MDIIKISVFGISAVLLALVLKSYRPEYSVFLSIAVCVCIFLFVGTKLELIIGYAEKMLEMIQIDHSYITMILKMVGITYIAEFASDICKDCGHQTIAGQIELFAKLSILVVGMPVLLAFMETFTLGFENMYLVTGESMELLNISVMEALTLMSQQIQLIFTNIAMMMLLKWNLMLNQTRLFWLRMNQMVMQSMLLIQTSLFTGMTVVHTGWTAKWVQFVSTVRSACVQVQSAVSALNNSVQSMCSSMLSAIHAVKAAASSMGTVSVRTRPVRGFASGGYPETGELFLARENGMNEMVGRIGNRSAVANNDQIVEAIRGAVVQGINGEGQNALLREQNALLRAILDKDVDVSLDGRSLVDGIDRARRRMGRSFQLA